MVHGSFDHWLWMELGERVSVEGVFWERERDEQMISNEFQVLIPEYIMFEKFLKNSWFKLQVVFSIKSHFEFSM